jgi:hypothetical protein
VTLCFHSKLVGAVMVVGSGSSIVDGYVMCHPKCSVITISWLNSEIITFLYDFVQKNLGCFGRMYFCMQQLGWMRYVRYLLIVACNISTRLAVGSGLGIFGEI